jgi:hypothetical protein
LSLIMWIQFKHTVLSRPVHINDSVFEPASFIYFPSFQSGERLHMR